MTKETEDYQGFTDAQEAEYNKAMKELEVQKSKHMVQMSEVLEPQATERTWAYCLAFCFCFVVLCSAGYCSVETYSSNIGKRQSQLETVPNSTGVSSEK